MCIVIFSYYKRATIDLNDDLNVEYPDNAKSDYDWAFYITIVSLVISVSATIANYVMIIRPRLLLNRTRSTEEFFLEAQI